MKKISTFAALAFIAIIGFTSCQKDYLATPPPPTNPTLSNPFQGSLSFKFGDTVLFEAEVKTAKLTEVNGIKSLSISGTRYAPSKIPGNFETISILIGNYTGAKKYLIGSQAYVTYTKVVKNVATTYTSSVSNANFHVTLTGDYVGEFQTSVVNQSNANDKILLGSGAFNIK